jgi:hypothetical protein
MAVITIRITTCWMWKRRRSRKFKRMERSWTKRCNVLALNTTVSGDSCRFRTYIRLELEIFAEIRVASNMHPQSFEADRDAVRTRALKQIQSNAKICNKKKLHFLHSADQSIRAQNNQVHCDSQARYLFESLRTALMTSSCLAACASSESSCIAAGAASSSSSHASC